MSDIGTLKAELNGLAVELDGVLAVYVQAAGLAAIRHVLSALEAEALKSAPSHDGLARAAGIVRGARQCIFGE